MTMTPAPEGCPPAYNGCTCPCHRTPGMFHLVACCMPSAEKVNAMTEDQDEIPPKRYGVTGSLGASHSHLANYILVDETGDGIWVMHAEWAVMKQERDQLKQQLAQETAAYTRMQGAATNIPSELDVRKIMLNIIPGPDGEGVEINAKNVAEVEEAMTELSDEVELNEGVIESLREVIVKLREECDDARRDRSFYDVALAARDRYMEERDRYMEERDDAVAKLNDALKANQAHTADLERMRQDKAGWKARAIGEDPEWQNELTLARAKHEQEIATWELFLAELIKALHVNPWVSKNDVQGEQRKAVLAAATSLYVRNSSDAKQLAAFEDMDFGRVRGQPGQEHSPYPVPVTIQCPQCGHWHVDEDKEVIDGYHGADGEPAGVAVKRNWAKHPHSTHRCAHCTHEWMPFPIKMPTVGVAPKLTSKEEDQWSIKYRELRNENDRWATAAADLAWRLGAEIGTLKKELEKALAGPWRPDLRKELDAALAEIGTLKKDANDAHAILTKHLVVRKWFPNGSEGAGVDRGIYERVQDMAIMLGNERADADRIRRERDDAKAEAKMYMDRDNGENKALLKERDVALQGKAHTASDCDMARRERDVALQQRDEARELCRSAKADVTTLRGLCKDLENKIQAMVQANAASAWGIAERDKMMKERDAALHQEEIALAALRALRKEADVFEADRDRLKSELAMPVGPDRLIDVNGDLLTVGEFVRDVQEEIRIRERAEADRDRFKQERDEARTAWDNMAKEVRGREVACERLVKESDGLREALLKDRSVLEVVLGERDVARTERDAARADFKLALHERDEARKEIDALNMRGMSDPIQLLISERDMARMERDETRRLVNDVCTKLAVPMMSTHDRVQRLADWYLAVRDEHESLVKERDQIREGYRELNSRHVALVEHWAPLKGSASEQALPVRDRDGNVIPKPGQGAFGTTAYPARADHWQRLADDRNQILTEIDTLAVNMGCSERMGTLQKVRWLVSELGQFKGMHEKLCKEVEAENWAVLGALKADGRNAPIGTRLEQIQALVRDRDDWRRIAQVCGYKGKDDLRIVPIPGPGQGAIGTTPYPPRNPDPIGGYGHPEGLTILECQSETLAILVHLHLAGSGWSTDRDLENALAEWCQVRYDRAKGMIKRGPAMDLLTKAVDAWCAQKVKGTK